MTPNLPLGTLRTPNGIYAGLWVTPRPITGHWGSGQVLRRLQELGELVGWGRPDLILGKQDQVDGFTVDIDPSVNPSIVSDWASMPFEDGQFSFGYWDPPYQATVDSKGMIHYSRLEPCYREICRVTRRLAILHPLVYPKPQGWHREAGFGVTFGPNKIIRSLQVFARSIDNSMEDVV